MAHLSLGVLGPLRALLDGTPVTAFESDKVCALLVYLAVEADRSHRRESLVGLLWPDCPERAARHNLRQALFSLRQAIDDHTATPPYLLISRDAIQFNRASDFSLDLAQFNTILRECGEDRSRGDQDPTIHAVRLEEMVQLYRGEFLQHFFLEDSAEFEQWALVQRERVHQHVLDACNCLVEYYALHRDFQAARHHASLQLELDPWREEAHCQMMRVLALEGQRSAALAQYETCRRILAEELGVEPSATTREVVEQIRAGKLQEEHESPSAIPAGPIYNLPVSLTSFVGREQELIDLDRLIGHPECRCISLVGPGGIGKTRLALQAAEQHRADFADGVAFVPLAPVSSAGAVIPAIASAVHLTFYGPSDPKVQLLNTLREKQMLLILDNVEQLLEDPPQASFVETVIEILERARGIRLLFTSREALNLQGEWVFEVGGLAFPEREQTERLDAYPAIALFVQRARHAAPGFAFHEADLAAIAQLCRMVEGMPLAIELAATWSRMLSPAETAQELEASLDVLSASVHDLPERHRSMRVVFDQTWRTLSATEQQVLSQLSVFRGGFGREAAEAVAGASLPVLSTLVSRTLLRRVAAGRYGLHVLIRQYCASRLAADPQALAAAQRRHYDYFLEMAEASGQGLKGRDQLEWLRRLEQEHDNLRAALQWALESDQAAACRDELVLRLSGALRLFWRMRGHFSEGRAWLTRSLLQCPHRRTAARAGALLGESLFAYALGDLSAARLSAEEGAAICREVGEQRGLAEALTVIGLSLVWRGQASLVQARLEEALAICREAGDRWGEAQASHYLGKYRAKNLGDPTGRAMLEESVAILEDLGEKNLLTVALISLGITEAGSGEYATARALFARGLALAREIEHPWGMANALSNLGSVSRILGEYSTAQSHLEQALHLYHQHGSSIWEADVRCALAENALSQGDLSTARFHLEEASHLQRTGENKWLELLVRYLQGMLAHYGGDGTAAMTLLEEATALAREGQYWPELAWALVALGRVTRTAGQVEPASELLTEGLDLFRGLGQKLGIASAIEELGAVSAAKGDGMQAAMLLSMANALREGMGAPLPAVDRGAHDAAVAACRAQLGETAFSAAWAQAAAAPIGEVVEEVLRPDRD